MENGIIFCPLNYAWSFKTDKDVIKIASNKKFNLERYPDGKSQNLRAEISKKFDCNCDKIICGAGSDEVIQMICQLSVSYTHLTLPTICSV